MYDLSLLLLGEVIGAVIKQGNKAERQGEIAHLYVSKILSHNYVGTGPHFKWLGEAIKGIINKLSHALHERACMRRLEHRGQRGKVEFRT